MNTAIHILFYTYRLVAVLAAMGILYMSDSRLTKLILLVVAFIIPVLLPKPRDKKS